MAGKIPRWLRKMNLGYEISLVLLGTANLILTNLNGTSIKIPIQYFETYSVICSILPVMWSKILDVSKKYHGELTPSTVSLQSEVDSVRSIPQAPALVEGIVLTSDEQTQVNPEAVL